MKTSSRRDFLLQGSYGLAVAGSGLLVLEAGAQPTQGSGDLGAYRQYAASPARPDQQPARANPPQPASWAITEDNILGPFHRPGAPFRAKITPPLEPGAVLLISGRVWAHDTRRPLGNAVLDVWQANAQGRYDNDDARRPPARDVFLNRARLITDDTGYYEFETIHPGPYQIGANTWRPSHIHYWIRHPGYRELVTQLYFRGDRHNLADAWIKDSLIIDLRDQRAAANQTYKTGTFDIVLAPAAAPAPPRR
jgi:catechol 1,2-dioxygenase